MPNWKKLIVSGSDATLNKLNVSTAVTASFFKGDGSALTNVSTTIAEIASKPDTFSSTTSKVITHNFGSKDVVVSVFDSTDNLIIPESIVTTDDNNVTITFAENTTGRAVVARGGHIVSGTVDYNQLSNVPSNLVSSSIQLASDISGSFTATSASFATTIGNLTSDYTELSNIPGGIISSSKQLPSNIVSSSLQLGSKISGSFTATSASLAAAIAAVSTDFSDITNKPTLISSSNQIASDISGSFTATSASFATTIGNLTSDYTELTNIPGGIISSSQQFPSGIVSSSNQITSFGDGLKITGSLVVSGSGYSRFLTDRVLIQKDLRHLDDSDTYLRFTNDSVQLTAGGTNTFEVSPSNVVVNNAGNDINFRVESSNNSNMIFVDAGNDKVGIGIVPSHTLSVAGTVSGSAFIGDGSGLTNLTLQSGIVSSSNQLASDISGSFTATSSSLASRISSNETITAKTLISSSNQIASDISGSITLTSASLAGGRLKNTTDTLTGNLTVTGTINAAEINTTYVSSSVIYNSGSNIFGDEASDQHQFTGSIDLTGPVTASAIQLVDSNTKLTQYDSNGQLNITTQHGYVRVGPNNTSYSHFNTDRSKFFFNKRILVDEGIVASYDDDLQLHAPHGTTRLTLDKDTGHATFSSAVSASAFSGSFVGDGSALTNLTLSSGIISSSQQLPSNIVSSSNQLASDISGSFTATSASFANTIDNLPTGDITSVTAGLGISGGGSSGAVTLTSEYLLAVDDRDMKPNTSGVGSSVKGVKPFFTSLGGMTSTADSDYQDVLVLDTYSDTSGGNANALSFDKSTQLIRHWQAGQTATSWGTSKTLAYTDSNISGFNNDSNYITAADDCGNAATLDGIDSTDFYRQIAENTATVGPGWMTVALSSGARGHADIIVSDGESGDHAFIQVNWLRSYADSSFTVLNTGGHVNRITGVRVIQESSDATYGNKYLQVYVTTSSAYQTRINKFGNPGAYTTDFTAPTPVIEDTKTGYAVKGTSLTSLSDYNFGAEQGVETNKLKVLDESILTGNVGIGTTSPGAALDVVGHISASGAISASAYIGDGSALTNLTLSSGIISSSQQLPSGIISSSQQFPSSIISSSKQLPSGIISSSQQLPSNIVSSSAQLSEFSGSFSGSFEGDGSALTGVVANVTQEVTVTDTFSSVTSKAVTHNFGTKNVIVSVYDSNDQVIIPASITTTNVNVVTVTFATATSGRVVVAKGGHIVSGSMAVDIVEETTVLDTFTSSTSKAVTHNFGTKNVLVSVYDNTDKMIIPQEVVTTDVNTVTITLATATTGRVIVAKGGHLVSGSSEATVDFGAVGSHILPSTTEIYDLGSSSKRWRDIYLSGSTIDLGGTKITRDGDGDIEFKDSNNNLKKVRAAEMVIGTGGTVKRMKLVGGKVVTTDNSGNVEHPATASYALTASFVEDSFISASAVRSGFGAGGTDISALSITGSGFTNASTVAVNHGFGTKEVVVSVYDNGDNLIMPSNIKTTTTGSVDITFAQPRTGRVVVSKGGHVVTSVTGFNAATAEALTAAGSRQGIVSVTTAVTASLFSTHLLRGHISMSLPSAVAGDWVKVSNRITSSYAHLVPGGAQKIMGSTDSLQIDSDNAGFELIYADSTDGWVIIGQ